MPSKSFTNIQSVKVSKQFEMANVEGQVMEQLNSISSFDELADWFKESHVADYLAKHVAIILNVNSSLKDHAKLRERTLELTFPSECWTNDPNDTQITSVFGLLYKAYYYLTVFKKVNDIQKVSIIVSFGRCILYSSDIKSISKYQTFKWFFPDVTEADADEDVWDNILCLFSKRFQKLTLKLAKQKHKNEDTSEMYHYDLIEPKFSENLQCLKITLPETPEAQQVSLSITSLKMPKLKSLEIEKPRNGFRGIEGPVVIKQLKGIPKLKNLKLSNVRLKGEDYDFEFLNEAETVSLDLHDNSDAVEKLFNSFSQHVRLLEVCDSQKVLENISSFEFPQLEYLLLQFGHEENVGFTDEAIESYFKSINQLKLPSLTTLSVKTVQISSLALVQNLPSVIKLSLQHLVWAFEYAGNDKQVLFNNYLNQLSDWIPGLKTLDIRLFGSGLIDYELELKDVTVNVETLSYRNYDFTTLLVLENFKAPELRQLLLKDNSISVDIGDPLYRFTNVVAPKLERLELALDSEITTPWDLRSYSNLKSFIFTGWTHEPWILKGDALQHALVNFIPNFELVGDFLNCKSFYTSDDEIAEKLKNINSASLIRLSPREVTTDTEKCVRFDLDTILEKTGLDFKFLNYLSCYEGLA